MKRLNKLLAILLAVTMMMSLAIVVQADPTYYVTIESAVEGQTYSAYKIFDAVENNGSYSYTIDSTISGDDNPMFTLLKQYSILQDAGSTNIQYFTFTESGTNPGTYVVEANVLDSTNVAELAAIIKAAIDANTSAYSANLVATGIGTGSDLTLDLDSGGPGYYFINTSLGSLTVLNTVAPSQTIQEKNDVPSVDKDVSEDNSTWSNESDAGVGDTVYYKSTITGSKALKPSRFTIPWTMVCL